MRVHAEFDRRGAFRVVILDGDHSGQVLPLLKGVVLRDATALRGGKAFMGELKGVQLASYSEADARLMAFLRLPVFLDSPEYLYASKEGVQIRFKASGPEGLCGLSDSDGRIVAQADVLVVQASSLDITGYASSPVYLSL